MDEKSEQILDAATRLFAARGVGDTSLAQIAGEVGIRKPSLLYHFSSKDTLHQAVLDRVLRRWNERLPKLMLAASTGEGRFDAVVGEAVSFFAEKPDRARLLIREMLDRPAPLREAIREHLGDWVAVVHNYIRAGQREGVVRSEVDSETFVMQAMHLIVGGIASFDVLGAFGDGDEPAFQAFLDHLIRFARTALFLDDDPTR